MLKTAYELLLGEHKKCLEIVASDSFYVSYANEKIRHSMQVAGAGNYLISRVEWLKNKTPEYIEMVKTAVLLHDVCRFAEACHYFYKKGKFDHGIAAADFLKNSKEFSDIRIWLPIRHHGHLIEALYDDADYQNITDENLKFEVEQICFIIRDADKIANLHMLVNEKNMQHLFFGKETYIPQIDGVVSDIIKEDAQKYTTVRRGPEFTVADRMTGFISWYFDINYQYSIDFCDRLNVTSGLWNLFRSHCIDADFLKYYQAHFDSYFATRQLLR